jgi:hypothetical protein
MIKEHSLLSLGLKYECMEHYCKGAPHCVDCGCHDLRDLVLDHLDGGGNEDRRMHCLGKGGVQYYTYLRRMGYPDDIRLEVRCGDCHRKRHRLERKVTHSRITISIEFDHSNPIPNAQPQPLWEL